MLKSTVIGTFALFLVFLISFAGASPLHPPSMQEPSYAESQKIPGSGKTSMDISPFLGLSSLLNLNQPKRFSIQIESLNYARAPPPPPVINLTVNPVIPKSSAKATSDHQTPTDEEEMKAYIILGIIVFIFFMLGMIFGISIGHEEERKCQEKLAKKLASKPYKMTARKRSISSAAKFSGSSYKSKV